MTDTAEEGYVFKNLIEASTQQNLGETIEFKAATSSSNRNAAGVVCSMTFDEAGERARQFGARFKAMSDACNTDS